MSRITADETILKLKQIFSRFEISQILVSNYGIVFNSGKFSNFCTLNGIQHFRTPSFHPQSGRLLEFCKFGSE